jgi:hypothetical protein
MMAKIKRALAMLAVALIAATGLVAATAAPAAAAYGDCPNGELCIFDGVNGGFPMYRFNSLNLNHCTNNGRATTTSSFTNRGSGTRVKFWSHSGCWLPGSGVVTTWYYYGASANLGLMDNQVWSFRWETCTGISACRF